METIKNNLSAYGIDPSKGRKYENIIYALALVYNILQAKVEDYLAPYGLSPLQFNLLMLVAYKNKSQGLKQIDISDHLIVSASNITKIVEKSVQKGLITRKINPSSRRENIIAITQKGKMLIDKIWPSYDKLVRSLTEKIPFKNQTQTEKILNNWLLALQQEK